MKYLIITLLLAMSLIFPAQADDVTNKELLKRIEVLESKKDFIGPDIPSGFFVNGNVEAYYDDKTYDDSWDSRTELTVGIEQTLDDVVELAGITPVGKSLKVPQTIMKATQKTNKYAGKKPTNAPVAKAGFATGGMTQGEFSHEKNPLTVVDKNGQNTGMELTGGEGVFDQKAMTLLDKYKQNKNYSKAGKLVFQEMESWKAAGTAKYGTRIKKY